MLDSTPQDFRVRDLPSLLAARVRPGRTLLVGLDGAAGSGKTTFTRWLADRLRTEGTAVSTVHLDQFFRPAAERLAFPSRLAVVEDMDWPRLRDQVLLPLRSGRSARFRLYDWPSDRLEHWQDIEVGGVTIVDGVTALRAELREHYDLRLWLSCPRDLRVSRLSGRGDTPDAEIRHWWPGEDRYVAVQDPRGCAHLVLDAAPGGVPAAPGAWGATWRSPADRDGTRAQAIPDGVRSVLSHLEEGLPECLGSGLVGIYLCGSLTQDAFVPARSDIDCLVVTREDLDEASFRRVAQWLAAARAKEPFFDRLEATFLIEGEVLTMDAHACRIQGGRLSRCGSDGNPLLWLNVLESGVTLYGPPPTRFLPAIGREQVDRALRRELDYLRAELEDPAGVRGREVLYRTYAVLTVCRILYTHATGRVTSKPVAARWAIPQVPEVWRAMIRAALAYQEGGEAIDLPVRQIEAFVRYAAERPGSDARSFP